MNYYLLIISLILGLIFGYYVLKRFSGTGDFVWFIIITFLLANMSVFIVDRYIISSHHIISMTSEFLLGLLIGVYLYLILVSLGIIKHLKRAN